MPPVASPRHPWKALFAVIAAFALVHGAGAHVFSHDHDHGHVLVGHWVQGGPDCDDDRDDSDVDVHFGPNFPFDDDGPDAVASPAASAAAAASVPSVASAPPSPAKPVGRDLH